MWECSFIQAKHHLFLFKPKTFLKHLIHFSNSGMADRGRSQTKKVRSVSYYLFFYHLMSYSFFLG